MFVGEYLGNLGLADGDKVCEKVGIKGRVIGIVGSHDASVKGLQDKE